MLQCELAKSRKHRLGGVSAEPSGRATTNRARTHLSQSKVYPDAASALKGLTFDGMSVMAGGFGLCGNPENLIEALRENGAKDIAIISNNCGADKCTPSEPMRQKCGFS